MRRLAIAVVGLLLLSLAPAQPASAQIAPYWLGSVRVDNGDDYGCSYIVAFWSDGTQTRMRTSCGSVYPNVGTWSLWRSFTQANPQGCVDVVTVWSYWPDMRVQTMTWLPISCLPTAYYPRPAWTYESPWDRDVGRPPVPAMGLLGPPVVLPANEPLLTDPPGGARNIAFPS